MKQHLSGLLAALFVASQMAGCANMDETQRTTATGAAVGAVAGALLGGVTAGGNKTKSAATGAAIGAALGAGGGYLWSRHMQEQKAAMEQATQGTGIGVTQTADNQLKLDIPSDLSFDSGRYDIKPALHAVLDRFATTLNQNPVTTVRVVGHTDNVGSDAVNNPLSVNRAAATRDYLVSRGVAGNRIAIDGRGSREPIADNATAAGKARNRRVEIFVAEAPR
ncbi:MAG: OmpA family protein [Azonexus sp.]|jgi:outer membrane protein OmpA-like peptidoglycan-associated protein|nr:OmpA family protein [Dechloromonas sp.]MBP8194030.1 OmpA family protein [Azonexus sp.]MBP9654885.1 OmpA family protein [Rhodocyclaceae bacterium]MBV2194094.1 OmpA family protein [Azonexus sp.]HRF30954.1 OmpA family protein [Azonexus sp.]